MLRIRTLIVFRIESSEGYTSFEDAQKQKKEGTKIKELTDFTSSVTDFTESDIAQRNAKIIFGFVDFMHSNGLLSEE